MITHCHRCKEPLTLCETYTNIRKRYRCTNYSCSDFASAVSVDITYENNKLISYWFVFNEGICIASSCSSSLRSNYFFIGRVQPQDIDGSFYDILFEDNYYLDFNDISELEDKARKFLKLKSFW